MPVFWRLLLSIYSILLILVAAAAAIVSFAEIDLQPYLQTALNDQNRIMIGAIAVLVLILALSFLILSWKQNSSDDDGILVQEGLLGEVSMTVAAIKLLIMRSIRQIDGIKDIRPEIKRDKSGLSVKLHMMINPELNVPEVTAATQKIVKEQLENIGGLQVNAVKVRVDDFKAGK